MDNAGVGDDFDGHAEPLPHLGYACVRCALRDSGNETIRQVNDVSAFDRCRRAGTAYGHILFEYAFHGVLLASAARFRHPGDEGFSAMDDRRVFHETAVRVLVIPRKPDDLKTSFCKDLAVLFVLRTRKRQVDSVA
jgi:hypothetical protein